MRKESPSRSDWIAPLLVILALIFGFFWGSRNPYIPREKSTDDEYVMNVEPQIEVWLSPESFFARGNESIRSLDELPARIHEYKATHSLRFAAVSCAPGVRLKDTVYALDELRKAGFASVTLIGYPKREPRPEPRRWFW